MCLCLKFIIPRYTDFTTQDKQESRDAMSAASRRDAGHSAPSSSSHGFSDRPSSSSGKSSRQIEDFFSEIKQRQDGKGGGANKYGDGDDDEDIYRRGNYDSDSVPVKGSFDSGDPHTTNIYLGNLSPATTGLCFMLELSGRYLYSF